MLVRMGLPMPSLRLMDEYTYEAQPAFEVYVNPFHAELYGWPLFVRHVEWSSFCLSFAAHEI